MIKKLFSWAFDSEDTEKVSPNSTHTATFQIRLNGEVIGNLMSEAGKWKFEYSDSFAVSKKLPLMDFPDKTRSYNSEDLWPFFLSRIPGLKQPGIQKILKDSDLNEEDTVALLKRFGRKSIQNPYVLEPVA